MLELSENWLAQNRSVLDRQSLYQSGLIFPSISKAKGSGDPSNDNIFKTLGLGPGLTNPRFVEVEFLDGYRFIRILNKLTNNTVYLCGHNQRSEINDFINIQGLFKSGKKIDTFIMDHPPIYPDVVREFDYKRHKEDDNFDYFSDLGANALSDYSFKDILQSSDLRDVAQYQILGDDDTKLHDGLFYTFKDKKPYEFDLFSNCLMSFLTDNAPGSESKIIFSDLLEEELIKLWVLGHELEFIEDTWKTNKLLQQLNILKVLQNGVDIGCYRCTTSSVPFPTTLMDLVRDRNSGLFSYKAELSLKYLLESLSNKKNHSALLLVDDSFITKLLTGLLEAYRQQRITNSDTFSFNRKRVLNGMLSQNVEQEDMEVMSKRKIVETILGFKIVDENKEVQTLGDKLNEGFKQLETDSLPSGMYLEDHQQLIKEDILDNTCGIINSIYENDFPNVKKHLNKVKPEAKAANPLYLNVEQAKKNIMPTHPGMETGESKKLGKFKKKPGKN